MKQPTKEVISFYRSDLAYEHLHMIKTTVSYYAGANDLVGWYNALETEYRMIWEYIKEDATHDKYDDKWFEDEWKRVRLLLYDARLSRDTPFTDNLKIINNYKAREILHTLNLLINKYEVRAKLGIAKGKLADPSRAMASYGN